MPYLTTINSLHFNNTNIQCLLNYGNVSYSNPPVNSLPQCSATINAQITSQSTSLCGVSSITLSADTGTGYSYRWQLNGNNITGATNQTYNATIAGNYSVIVSVNCALDTSNTITITSGVTPSAAINALGPINFCIGNYVTLVAITGIGLSYQWQVNGNNISGGTSSSYFATSSGNYSVIVSNNCGNSISNIIFVNVTSVPGSVDTIAGPTSFCRFTTQTFSVAPAAGATNYVWSVPPQATIISGQGTNSIIVNFKTNQGYVTVKAANQCGVGPLSILPVQVLKCIQANNAVMRELETSDSEISIFPIPANSKVTIQFYSEKETTFSLKIYDVHGRVLLKENSVARKGLNEIIFDLENFSKGICFVEIFLDESRILKKLVIN